MGCLCPTNKQKELFFQQNTICFTLMIDVPTTERNLGPTWLTPELVNND